MIIIYTGTPPNIKVNGIHFHTGQPVEVPNMVGELLIRKDCFTRAVQPSFEEDPVGARRAVPLPRNVKKLSDKGD